MIWLWLLAGCAKDEAPEKTDSWTPPSEDGAWFAGTRVVTVKTRGGLELPTQIWYPSTDQAPAAAVYDGATPGEADGGAPDCSTARPVVLFSHGNGGLRYQSWFLTEHLARHGYVVVAPSHVGNTTFDLDSVPRPEMAVRRPLDITAAFDHVAALDDDLADCIDPDAGFAMMGHSFGGYTTLAVAGAPLDVPGYDAYCDQAGDFVCGAEDVYVDWFGDEDGDLSDDRVWAAAPISPAARRAFHLQRIKVPTLVLGGLIDDLTPWNGEVADIYGLLQTRPRYLAGLEDTGHFSFTNFCIPGQPGCNDGDLPLEDVYRITNTVLTAFLDVQRGEPRSADWLPPEDEPSLTVWQEKP